MKKALRFVLFWMSPDFHHPVRRALRRAGIEATRTARATHPEPPHQQRPQSSRSVRTRPHAAPSLLT